MCVVVVVDIALVHKRKGLNIWSRVEQRPQWLPLNIRLHSDTSLVVCECVCDCCVRSIFSFNKIKERNNTWQNKRAQMMKVNKTISFSNYARVLFRCHLFLISVHKIYNEYRFGISSSFALSLLLLLVRYPCLHDLQQIVKWVKTYTAKQTSEHEQTNGWTRSRREWRKEDRKKEKMNSG